MSGRCIACLLSTRERTIATDFDGEDFIDNADDIRRRDRSGRPSDMPSRSDRNRARRLAHREGFAWILSRAPRLGG